ncbi:MAG: Alternative oxidase/tellurite resistance protein TehB [Parcubacteria bacterium C7867-001]|nr:MAG: Alternative oxidase/tellurite resistance protein TehB [Parcubacteria bacterium C7867-001]
MQEKVWEREYRSKKMLSPSNVPHADVVRFAKWYKKRERQIDREFDFDRVTILDLGSGTGRNAFYFAERGAKAIGYEISDTALSYARSFASDAGLSITYEKRSIGEQFALPDASIDIILDITSSNSLSDSERAVYLAETHRVLKPNGILLVRALSKEADKHAKELIARFPGPDEDTYIHPDLGVTEKVFTKESFTKTYGDHFSFIDLERIEHYATVAGRKYKRQYWLAYLAKN